MFGQGGNDTLSGGNGDDWLIGNDGSDVVNGGLGKNKTYSGDNSSSELRALVATRLTTWSVQFSAFGTAQGLRSPSPWLTSWDLDFDDDDDDDHRGGVFVLWPKKKW